MPPSQTAPPRVKDNRHDIEPLIPVHVRSARLVKRILAVPALVLICAVSMGASGGTPGDSVPEGESPPATVPEPELRDRETPEGFTEMAVYTVAPTEMGNVVLLSDRYGSVFVPIWIGETEALAIALRLEGRGFQRPLTHDLVDALLREFGANLVEVRIDSLQANTFVASLYIHQGDREILLDSRASDSIALALGSRVPIFVSDRVVQETGIRAGDLNLPPFEPGQGPASPPTEEGEIPL